MSGSLRLSDIDRKGDGFLESLTWTTQINMPCHFGRVVIEIDVEMEEVITLSRATIS